MITYGDPNFRLRPPSAPTPDKGGKGSKGGNGKGGIGGGNGIGLSKGGNSKVSPTVGWDAEWNLNWGG